MKWKPQMVLLWVLFLCLLAGCRAHPEKSNGSTRIDTEHLESFLKRSDELYGEYLDGNQKQARNSLEELVKNIEAAKLKPYGHANTLYVTYSRLYALDKRTGNEKLAEADFVQVQNWLLQRLELNGQSEAQAEAEVKNYTAERCLAEVDDWDKEHHNGMLPNYLNTK